MELIPDQVEFIERVYGPEGDARVRLAINSEPKGNGKTGLTAGLSLCHLLGPEAVPRGEVFSASIDRDMAGVCFAEMEAIILEVPEFAVRVNVQRFHKRMEVIAGDGEGSTYVALSADARKAHGRAPSFWCYDELAQAKDGELLENLIRSAGKQKACLGMVLSTQAPDDNHPLSLLIDDAIAHPDASVVLMLRTAPMDADPFDPEVIKACNPAAGIFLDVDDIISEAERARRQPVWEASYRNLRLNQRIDTQDDLRILPKSEWQALAGHVDLAALEGRRCWGGLDLSGKDDLTALVLAFEPEKEGDAVPIVPFFWTPEGQLEKRKKAEQDLFRSWIDQGFIEAMPGKVIRFRKMARALADIKKRFDLVKVGFDRWRIDDFMADMADEDLELPLEPYGQGYVDMGPAVERFTELAQSGEIMHDGNPVLTAALAGAIVSEDAGGNKKVEKGKSNKRATVRIDGLVAALMAVGTMRRFEDEGGGSYMDEHDMVAIE